MDVLAISGSIRPASYNTALLKAAAKLSPEDLTISIFNALDTIPVFQPDIDETSTPAAVIKLRKCIRESNGILFSTPEYAHNITGIVKNALDWLVVSGELVLKPVAVTSVSTSGLGGARAYGSLVLILSAMNANVVVDASLNVPFAKNKFDDKLELIDTITSKALGVTMLALERAIKDNA